MAASFSGMDVDDTMPPGADFDKISPGAPKMVMTRARTSEPPKAAPASPAPPESEPEPQKSRAWLFVLVVLVSAAVVVAWLKLH